MGYTPAIWPLLIAAGFLAGLAIYARRYRNLPPFRPFALLMWLGAWYALSSAMGICSTSLTLRIFWHQMDFIATSFAGPVYLAMALDATGKTNWLTRGRLMAILAVPVITNLLADTSTLHHLFTYDYHVVTSSGIQVLAASTGPWYWVHFVYSVGLIGIGCVLFVVAPREQISTRNKIALISAIILQVMAEVLYALGIT
ncbi:MAG: hypothetical protein LLG44_13750, partial [Chloroflexi bacterium]|nr:hypothetical protein [Chloroflexota bacterium]